MTMEYIRHMNQGIAFNYGHVITLFTLSQQYPRYLPRLWEAEEALNEMLISCVNPDGSVFEGPTYWQYTVSSALPTMFLLARAKKQPFADYAGERLKNLSEFGLFLLSDNGKTIPVGDGSVFCYHPMIANLLWQITNSAQWHKIAAEQTDIEFNLHRTDNTVMYFISAQPLSHLTSPDVSLHEGFSVFHDVGYTSVKRNGVRFLGLSGKSYSHCHGDKGSFIVEKNGEAVISDRGILEYSLAGGAILTLSETHNLLVPEDENARAYSQFTGKTYSASLNQADYKNGVFIWETDNTGVWSDAIVKKSVRRVVSEESNVFLITDEMILTKPMVCSFRLNILNENAVEVTPVDWQPVSEWLGVYGVDYKRDDVLQLRLYTAETDHVFITTRITIL